MEAIWTRRCSTAEVQRRRVLNSKRPVCRLPNEILSLIFLQYLPPSDSDELKSELSMYKRFRDAVGGVCFRFRNVLLNTPLCWSNISIDTSYLILPDPAKESPLLAALERSNPALIRLHFSDRGHSGEFTPGKQSIEKILRRHVHRCQSLVLEVYDPHLAVKLTSEGKWPQLQHLHLKMRAPSEETLLETFSAWSILQNPLPSLGFFDMHDEESFLQPAFSTLLHPTSITHVVLNINLNPEPVCEFLKLCVSLEDLWWQIWFTPDDTDYPLPRPARVQASSKATS